MANIIDKVTIDGTDVPVVDAESVHFTEQELEEPQKATARQNIGAIPIYNGVYVCSYWQNHAVNDLIKGATSGAAVAVVTGQAISGLTAPLLVSYGNIDRGQVSFFGFDATGKMFRSTINLMHNTIDDPTIIEEGGSDLSLGITGAQVGQIAKITAVDTDGKPTAWEPVDMAGGGEREWEVIADIITTSEDVLYYRYDVPDKKELIVLVSLTPLADSTSSVNGTIAINGTGNPWNGNNYTYISGNILSVKSSERGMSIVLSGEIIDRKWVPKSLFGSLNKGASWNALRPDGTMPLTSDDTTNACSFTSVDAIRSVAVGSYKKWFGVGSHIYILAR